MDRTARYLTGDILFSNPVKNMTLAVDLLRGMLSQSKDCLKLANGLSEQLMTGGDGFKISLGKASEELSVEWLSKALQKSHWVIIFKFIV